MNQVERRQEIEKTGLITDILWSDPHEEDGFAENPRGAGCLFGPAQTEAFCKQNGFDYVVRSHQVPIGDLGYTLNHDEKCVTIWNAPNYCGKLENKASVGYIGEDLKLDYLVFEQTSSSDE